MQNAQQLVDLVGDDQADPTNDEREANIANGNNTANTTGIQFPPPTQTTLPGNITQTPTATNLTPPPGKNTPATSTGIWDGVNYDVQLSPNFILRYFTCGYGTNASQNTTKGCLFPHPLTDFNLEYTAQVRFANLQCLAVQVLEPLMAQFGPFRINSGIRNENTVSRPS